MLAKDAEISTRQLQILKELRDCEDEMSGQQLHRALQNSPSKMGLTTVYRNLRTLQEKGVVRCRNLPTGEVLYSPVERDSHHFTCVKCGNSLVLEYCPLTNIDLSLKQARNFQVLFHTLELFGLCQECSLRNQSINQR